ncbi:Protein CBG27744 [Caenorhabditis briggsae]|uniref:Protein CBG27744 n=1 Tax=Caenorhabditis briggsae TaxID=6238 RepID=B6IJ42_CAEBR|nr:Protein CBG27744 [Caenorhabditis briggsae]CAS00022.1 Protein CBG27744 [Caenorhabditis briggsae]
MFSEKLQTKRKTVNPFQFSFQQNFHVSQN